MFIGSTLQIDLKGHSSTAVWKCRSQRAPGLVSHVDNGAHRDMDAELLCRSSTEMRTPFFRDLALAGAEGAGMSRLRAQRCRHPQAARRPGIATAVAAAISAYGTDRLATAGLGRVRREDSALARSGIVGSWPADQDGMCRVALSDHAGMIRLALLHPRCGP
jgi:triphosphoribosyl-dephospho-CoA synthetase